MKANNLINPFNRMPESKLLLIGLISLGIASLFSVYFDIIYDGVINIHATDRQTLGPALVQQLIAVSILTLILWLTGCGINRKTRWIDILTAVLIFRIPLYLLAFVVPLSRPMLKELPALDRMDQFQPGPVALLLFSLMGIVGIGLLLYAVVLLINGFKVATNSKKNLHLVFVLLGLLLADLCSKWLITRLYTS
ncbi:YIP1 family protein [Niabella terrae]